MTWRDKAACRNITTNPNFNPEEDPFYDPPDREDGGDKWEYARAMCARCPVRATCLDEALNHEQDVETRREGFRGGYSPAQRHRIFLGLPVGPIEGRPKQKRRLDLDEFMFLVGQGVNPVAAAHQLERTIHAIDKAAWRAGRKDITSITTSASQRARREKEGAA